MLCIISTFHEASLERHTTIKYSQHTYQRRKNQIDFQIVTHLNKRHFMPCHPAAHRTDVKLTSEVIISIRIFETLITNMRSEVKKYDPSFARLGEL